MERKVSYIYMEGKDIRRMESCLSKRSVEGKDIEKEEEDSIRYIYLKIEEVIRSS